MAIKHKSYGTSEIASEIAAWQSREQATESKVYSKKDEKLFLHEDLVSCVVMSAVQIRPRSTVLGTYLLPVDLWGTR